MPDMQAPKKEAKMPMEILILDDEPIVGQRLKAALEKEGHHAETFVDPIQVVARLEEKTFDIVVTDIRMDDMDGIEILELVRKKSDRTKVIMITGYATLEVARESLTKGAFDFIAKPFKLREMRQAIDKAVEALNASDQKRPTGNPV
jgi:DNA-binding NtrC family response regulator